MRQLQVIYPDHPQSEADSRAQQSIAANTRTLIGYGRGCDIRLSAPGVARRHAELRDTPEGLYIRTLASRHQLCLNDAPCRQAGPLTPGDELTIGSVSLSIESTIESHPTAPQSPLPVEQIQSPAAELPTTSRPPAQLIRRFQEAISESLDLYRRDVLQTLSPDKLRDEAKTTAYTLISDGEVHIPDSLNAEEVVATVVAETVGLGPIEALMDDQAVSEIMVNGHERIYVERNGRVEPTAQAFSSATSLASVLERIVSPLGRRLDEGSPLVDARLPDGSRVNAIIPPLALNGPVLTIRRFSQNKITLDNLIGFGALDTAMKDFLVICIHQRRNILISGGTGTGKTTILNALSAHIPEAERIITIEDSAELQLDQDHVVALESRPANIEGSGAIPIRDLVRNALRMRPDRILVGECRGGEALDMLQAMNTGHDGSLTTAHANSPRDALARLEVMTLMAGMELPARAIRDQITAAIDIVVQLTRFGDGSRRITAISEVAGMEGEQILITDLFRYRRHVHEGRTPASGHFEPTGQIPAFYEAMREEGLLPDLGIFQRDKAT